MLSHETQLRVRYAETDQMGYVYYGKYAEYFEVGRVELIRSFGLSYKEIEERGIFMPVADLEIKYKRAAQYDELLTIRTSLPEFPKARFITFYQIYNEQRDLLVRGKVVLAFVDKVRKRPVRAPEFITEAVSKHWPQKG